MLFVLLLAASVALTGADIVCSGGTFSASCRYGVILMQDASYGLKPDVSETCGLAAGNGTCFTDVVNLLHNKCSGNERCEVQIPSNEMTNLDCFGGADPYLVASYMCVNAMSLQCGDCEINGGTYVFEQRAYLSSTAQTGDAECGGVGCPFVIQVLAGQRIDVYLLDFEERRTPDYPNICQVYALIQEPGVVRRSTICGSMDNKRKLVYRSTTHEIHLALFNYRQRSPNSFMIYYEATGCPDLASPINGWIVTREGDRITLTCYSTGETSILVCREWWVGAAFGRCPIH